MIASLKDLLQKKKDNDSLRQLKIVDDLIDFSSNDYLGLARSKELFEMIKNESGRIRPPYNGATGSRLLSGNSELAEEVENSLANIFHSDKTLLFNSGYSANLAVLSSLPQRGDTIIYDELAHTCIKDGARLSLASRFSFSHNDLSDLEEKIKRAKGNIFLAVESIYSMDGDECPLEELVALAQRYNAKIIVDEAHSTGSYGENGSGLCVQKELASKIDVRIYTFGKAMGVHGACVAGDETLINYLVNFARPFIYTTAMPPHSLIAVNCAFKFLSQKAELQLALQRKLEFFLRSIKNVHLKRIESHSAIQSIVIPGNTAAKKLAEYLQQKNYDCRPILSPTIKEGSERVRICLHAFNTEDEIRGLSQHLAEFES